MTVITALAPPPSPTKVANEACPEIDSPVIGVTALVPPPPPQKASSETRISECQRSLQWDGWTRLPDDYIQLLREWAPSRFVERMHRRYHKKIVRMMEKWRSDWDKGDEGGTAPGADRTGGLVARRITDALDGTGIFVYAAHPSQKDDAEDYDYSGPRWYITLSEALMKHYKSRKLGPLPPPELQGLLWPAAEDRNKPWLTELGWTCVPEGSDSQVMHADICYAEGPNPRKPGRGRYHHFAWKTKPGENCTTNVVPGAFTEGCAEWDHYEDDKWQIVGGPALIFDSEMLHRGGKTKPGVGWTSTLTLQVCSGSGYGPLTERVSENLMWYTQPLGWAVGDAVEVFVDPIACWQRALISTRNESGTYSATVEGSLVTAANLTDTQVRRRSIREGATCDDQVFTVGTLVEALYEGKWYVAKVVRCNLDKTHRLIWKVERTFTDGVSHASIRLPQQAVVWKEPLDPAKAPVKRSLSQSEALSPVKKLKFAKIEKQSAKGEPAQMQSILHSRGYVELTAGLPDAWRWAVFDFVEACYDRYHDVVVQELDLLHDLWEPCKDSEERHGAFAAAKVTERLKDYGIAIYSPGTSQEEKAPFTCTGPRWYVSVTQAALKHFGDAPAPPAELQELLCGHPADSVGELRARGIGWTLAPRGSDPQALHADIWGHSAHARTGDRTRWPHLMWKRQRSDLCTTQVVPYGFTDGVVNDCHFDQIEQVRSPAILVDSECLHRGAPTPAAPKGTKETGGYVSTLSLELCTPSGWAAWEAYETSGTTKDPSSPLDWRMLKMRRPDPTSRDIESAVAATHIADGVISTLQLAPAPWQTKPGMDALRLEQEKWEMSSF